MRCGTFFLSSMMILVLICSSLDDEVAAPLEMWSRTYGEAYDDRAYSLVEASDGGFALVGTTRPSGGFFDFWLVRTDANGAMLWNCTYGGENWDEARALVETSDGGFALAGCTYSFGAGSRDAWLVKVDAYGNVLWNYTYGGVGWDDVYALVESSDGGFALAGMTMSFGDSIGDAWLVKTDANGNMLWNRTYGGKGFEIFQSLVEASDGGFAIAGYKQTFNPDNTDFWLVKTDANGRMLWNKGYEGAGLAYACSLVEASDGGFAIAGYKQPSIGSATDALLVKVDANGNMLWNKTYGGESWDAATSLVKTSDRGFALGGHTRSFGAGYFDFWLVRTDANGAMLWNCTYGGENWDEARALVETSDGGFALAGCTYSFGAGQCDFWLVKTEPIATPTETPTTELSPTTLIAVASSVSITAAAACLIYYHKRRNAKS